jgi:hypothetical protein
MSLSRFSLLVSIEVVSMVAVAVDCSGSAAVMI